MARNLNSITVSSIRSNETKSKPARNRRRAKDLADTKLREIKRDFDIRRNTQDVAQEHLLPRAEAVDALLIRHSDEIYSVRQELAAMRRDLGLDASRGIHVVSRRAA